MKRWRFPVGANPTRRHCSSRQQPELINRWPLGLARAVERGRSNDPVRAARRHVGPARKPPGLALEAQGGIRVLHVGPDIDPALAALWR